MSLRENQIYTSSRYDDFRFKEANRDVDMKHAERIADRMKEVGWEGAPIEVSVDDKGLLVIEDGQHRYVASKKSNTPVRFIIVRPRDEYDVAVQNSLVRPWKKEDFINLYATQGNQSYMRLRNLVKEFPNISFSTILDATKGSGTKRKDFERGYVRISDMEYFKARECLKTLTLLIEGLNNTKIKTKSNYIRVLCVLLKYDLIDGDRMVEKLDTYGRMVLPESVTALQAVEYLEILYNYRQRKDVVYLRDDYKRKAKGK